MRRFLACCAKGEVAPETPPTLETQAASAGEDAVVLLWVDAGGVIAAGGKTSAALHLFGKPMDGAQVMDLVEPKYASELAQAWRSVLRSGIPEMLPEVALSHAGQARQCHHLCIWRYQEYAVVALGGPLPVQFALSEKAPGRTHGAKRLQRSQSTIRAMCGQDAAASLSASAEEVQGARSSQGEASVRPHVRGTRTNEWEAGERPPVQGGHTSKSEAVEFRPQVQGTSERDAFARPTGRTCEGNAHVQGSQPTEGEASEKPHVQGAGCSESDAGERPDVQGARSSMCEGPFAVVLPAMMAPKQGPQSLVEFSGVVPVSEREEDEGKEAPATAKMQLLLPPAAIRGGAGTGAGSSPVASPASQVSPSFSRVSWALSESDSLAYSQNGSSERGFSKVTIVAGVDAEVQTSLCWVKGGFQCTNCARPPMPKPSSDAERAMAALGKAPPAKHRSRLDDVWTLLAEHGHLAPEELWRLFIHGSRFTDNHGNVGEVSRRGKEAFIEGCKLTFEGDNLLHIVNPMGQHLVFTRGDGGRGLGSPLIKSAEMGEGRVEEKAVDWEAENDFLDAEEGREQLDPHRQRSLVISQDLLELLAGGSDDSD